MLPDPPLAIPDDQIFGQKLHCSCKMQKQVGCLGAFSPRKLWNFWAFQVGCEAILGHIVALNQEHFPPAALPLIRLCGWCKLAYIEILGAYETILDTDHDSCAALLDFKTF